MKLYVANCSTQLQSLNFRMVEVPGRGYSTQNIGMARQEQIAGDMNRLEIDYLLKQFRNYGVVEAADVAAYKGHYVAMIYAIDQPVPHKLWHDVMERNKTVKRDEGAKLRRDAALATSHGMREFSPNAADNLSLSVQEEKPGTMDHGGEQPLAEGYRMSTEPVY